MVNNVTTDSRWNSATRIGVVVTWAANVTIKASLSQPTIRSARAGSVNRVRTRRNPWVSGSVYRIKPAVAATLS